MGREACAPCLKRFRFTGAFFYYRVFFHVDPDQPRLLVRLEVSPKELSKFTTGELFSLV